MRIYDASVDSYSSFWRDEYLPIVVVFQAYPHWQHSVDVLREDKSTGFLVSVRSKEGQRPVSTFCVKLEP